MKLVEEGVAIHASLRFYTHTVAVKHGKCRISSTCRTVDIEHAPFQMKMNFKCIFPLISRSVRLTGAGGLGQVHVSSVVSVTAAADGGSLHSGAAVGGALQTQPWPLGGLERPLRTRCREDRKKRQRKLYLDSSSTSTVYCMQGPTCRLPLLHPKVSLANKTFPPAQ